MAATAMAAGLAGTALHAQAQKPGDVGYPYGDLKEVVLRGRVVSLGDELARKYGARTAASGTEKQLGLALPEGQLYTFLENERYRKLLAAQLTDRMVEVKARHFPRSMLLEITEVQPVTAEGLKRQFFCAVCNITTDDWGPCACCGKEMAPVREKQAPR